MESHETGFPPFPHSLEIPLGFPHSHGLDDRIYVLSYPSTGFEFHGFTVRNEANFGAGLVAAQMDVFLALYFIHHHLHLVDSSRGHEK